MKQKHKLRILGLISILLGCIASVLCLFPDLFFFAVIVAFFGMLISTIYIFIDYKYDINKKIFTAGVLGMLLSSLPILIIVAFNFITHFKNQ